MFGVMHPFRSMFTPSSVLLRRVSPKHTPSLLKLMDPVFEDDFGFGHSLHENRFQATRFLNPFQQMESEMDKMLRHALKDFEEWNTASTKHGKKKIKLLKQKQQQQHEHEVEDQKEQQQAAEADSGESSSSNKEASGKDQQLGSPKVGAKRPASEGLNDSANAVKWTEWSQTWSSVQSGDDFVSHKRIKLRDDSGNEEMMEERQVNGTKLRKTITKTGSNANSGDENMRLADEENNKSDQSASETKDSKQQLATSSNGTVECEGAANAEEFESIWSSNKVVQLLYPHTVKAKTLKSGSGKETANNSSASSPKSSPINTAESEANKQSKPDPITVDLTNENKASEPLAEFSESLRQLSQLGFQNSPVVTQLLKENNGRVDATVHALLCIQRLKQLPSNGQKDDLECLQLLKQNSFDIEKAAQTQ